MEQELWSILYNGMEVEKKKALLNFQEITFKQEEMLCFTIIVKLGIITL